ncbi:MAG: DUF6356 family protein [Sphingomonadaceae bacterium]
MIDRIFLAHPRTVGETYAEHFRVASGFGAAMIVGGTKAFIHAIFPNLYPTAGSDTVRKLHAILVEKRNAKRDAIAEMNSVEWMI